MKNGKKPNRQQQALIENNGLNPQEWLIFKKVAKEFHLVHRVKGTKRVISA